MKRNIGKFAANIAAAGVILGAAVVFADDQQNQQSSSTTTPDQSQQAGQASQSGQPGESSSGAASSATGTSEAAGAQTPIAQIAQDPQQFIKAAYAENLAEVKLGKLAQEKGQNQQTKDLGQSLVQDHQKMLDDLKKLADQKNVQVSDQLGPMQQRAYDALSSLSGADFDKRFANQQVRMHKRAIALYQQAAQSNTDAEVKQFAQQNVAGLQHHLQMAQEQGGISEPAGAGTPQEQGSSAQPQQGQSAQPGQAEKSGQSAQPEPAKP